ncbi:copper chaperone PCu(A)C [Chitinilyticum litopenaei]|uniref:copper chaperone PCu(A)C n=1 Tax=Chitinilyticum litopenaei TaxID=1121276 RepID=UPI0003FAC804|nr:copper chaperone PCu(A)C [Chitinilyticum litopenaei]
MFKSLLGAAALLAALTAQAHEFTAGDVRIDHPWARATVATARNAGAFLTLTSAKGDQLLGVASPVADKVEVHEMKMEGNVMKMRPLPALELPAGKTVELVPGGYHIMLIGLKRQLKEGERFPLVLTFAKGGRAEVQVQVDALTAQPAAAAKHEHH